MTRTERAALLTDPRLPMKRWNQKGSFHAKQRMEELRARKRRHEKHDLIVQWEIATGWQPGQPTWFDHARKAGLQPGCGVEASIAFLRDAIAKAKSV